MVGVITGWDVFTHPVVTIRCFGWQVFFRAVAPWQDETFLSLLQSGGFQQDRTASDASHDTGTLHRPGIAGQANLHGLGQSSQATRDWWGRSSLAWPSRSSTMPTCWRLCRAAAIRARLEA